MGYLGDRWSIGDTLYFEAQTQGSSGPTDADTAPSYRVYEQGVSTPLLTGNFSLVDAVNTDGFYEASIQLTAANGFDVGKSYYIRKYGEVSSAPGAKVDYFRITNAGATAHSGVSGWPTLSDVQVRLDEMGLTAPSDDTIEAQIAAAIVAWERATNYEPFLGTGIDETRYLTGEGFQIDFQGGLTDAPTTLTINGNYDDTGVYENGVTLVVNRDYILYPQNALARSKPYTYCKLKRYHTYREEGGVKVVAPFGYAETVPSDAWEAVMKCILSMLFPAQLLSVTGGIQQWKEADVEEDYGKGEIFGNASDYFKDYCREIIAFYRRLVVS